MIAFAGNEYPVTDEYYYCENCGHEWVSPAQLKESLERVTAIKRRAQVGASIAACSLPVPYIPPVPPEGILEQYHPST